MRSFDISGNSLSGFSRVFTVTQPVDVSNTSSIQARGRVTYQGQAFSPAILTGPLTFNVEPFRLREGPPIPAPPGSIDRPTA